MPTSTEPPSIWRAKAEEARAHAARMTDQHARLTMLKIAESYEHLADIVEKAVAATRPKP
jgi:hypothetical protein